MPHIFKHDTEGQPRIGCQADHSKTLTEHFQSILHEARIPEWIHKNHRHPKVYPQQGVK